MSDDTDTSVTRTADRLVADQTRPRLGKRKKRRPMESDGGIELSYCLINIKNNAFITT